MIYSLKNIKFHSGMEGQGFNASLYRDGIKIGSALNEGSGGMTFIYYDNPAERTIMEKHCAAQPQHKCSFNDSDGKPYMLDITPDLLIDHLIEDYQLAKDFARLIKGKISFITSDNKIYSMKGEMSDKARAYILGKYPAAKIFNELSAEQGVALMKEAR